MLEKAVGAGYGDADNSAIFLAYDRPLRRRVVGDPEP